LSRFGDDHRLQSGLAAASLNLQTTEETGHVYLEYLLRTMRRWYGEDLHDYIQSSVYLKPWEITMLSRPRAYSLAKMYFFRALAQPEYLSRRSSFVGNLFNVVPVAGPSHANSTTR
jgi:hypothetical protein